MDAFFQLTSPIDWVLIAVAVWWFLRGWKRGLSKELGSLVVLFLLLVGGWKLYRPLAFLIREKLDSVRESPLVDLASYAIALFLIYAGARISGLLVTRMVKAVSEGGLERFGGGLAGGAKALAVYGLILIAVDLSPSDSLQKLFYEDSIAGQWMGDRLPETTRNWMGRFSEWMDANENLDAIRERFPGSDPALEVNRGSTLNDRANALEADSSLTNRPSAPTSPSSDAQEPHHVDL